MSNPIASPTPVQAPSHAIGLASAGVVTSADANHIANQRASQRSAELLASVSRKLAPQRTLVHAGDVLYRSGDRFSHLYLLNSGSFKVVSLLADGREQVVGCKFRGDWLGFEGIADDTCACDAVAMDTGEVWALRYDSLLDACCADRALMTALHQAMSRETARHREALMSVCTLPADARVADFLHQWSESLARCGLRNDEIALRMTRAEIGNHLGLTLETVSRAMSRLARDRVIRFDSKGRRDVHIADVRALSAFVQRCLAPVATPALQ